MSLRQTTTKFKVLKKASIGSLVFVSQAGVVTHVFTKTRANFDFPGQDRYLETVFNDTSQGRTFKRVLPTGDPLTKEEVMDKVPVENGRVYVTKMEKFGGYTNMSTFTAPKTRGSFTVVRERRVAKTPQEEQEEEGEGGSDEATDSEVAKPVEQEGTPSSVVDKQQQLQDEESALAAERDDVDQQLTKAKEDETNKPREDINAAEDAALDQALPAATGGIVSTPPPRGSVPSPPNTPPPAGAV